MFLLPDGEYAHKNLNTSFVVFESLLHDLALNGFHGYVTLSYWDLTGHVFLRNGHLIQVLIPGEEPVTGWVALDQLLHRARRPDGFVDVVQVAPDAIESLALVVDSVPVELNGTVDSAGLPALFRKLRAEKFSGYVIIYFSEPDRQGMVVVQKGKISLAGEEKEPGGRCMLSLRSLKSVFQEAENAAHSIQLYQSNPARAPQIVQEMEHALSERACLRVLSCIALEAMKLTDRALGQGAFSRRWQETAATISRAHPSVDPLTGRILLHQGRIMIKGYVPFSEMVKALRQQFVQLFTGLSHDLEEHDFIFQMDRIVSQVVEKHRDRILQYKLDRRLPEILK